MRPLLLNSYDSHGGAAIAAMRLDAALRDAGVESRFMAQLARKPGVLGPRNMPGKIAMMLRYKLEAAAMRHYPKATRDFSAHVTPSATAARVRRFAPDLVHIHWVSHGMLRIEDFSRLGAPLVCTMHDMWAFTGGCHYSGDCDRYRESCGRCPALGSERDDDLSRGVWRRKKAAWRNLPIQLIAPSRWLAGCAGESSLFHGHGVKIIPNTLDTTVFRPQDQAEMRRRCGLPQFPKLILFGAIDSLNTGRKGAHLLLPALEQLRRTAAEPLELVVLGSSGPRVGLEFPLPAHYAGYIDSDARMAEFYAAADAIVLPSVQDNLPNVALEAMACGRPCVAFDVGGLPDLIVHGETGYLARPFSSEDLAEGVVFCLDADRAPELQYRARLRVETQFSPSVVAAQHLSLYRDILAKAGRS